MRRILNRIFFIIKFSIKNLLYKPLRTFLLILGFLGISLSLLFIFSMHNVMYQYYYGKIEDIYKDYDVIMEVNEHSGTRFFSTSYLTNNETINQYDPFFEFDVLASANSNDSYVHVYASNINSFKNISGVDQINFDQLASNQTIVTSSYAQKYNLDIGDVISIYASDTVKNFYIVEIVSDQQLFKGDSIFIDKITSLSFFLESLNPTLATLSPTLLTNLYNKVYIDLNSDASFEDFLLSIDDVTSYDLLSFHMIYDLSIIESQTNRMMSLFDSMMVFIFLAIILVLQTTLIVYVFDKKKNNATIYLLGGTKILSTTIILIELLILSIIGFILGIYLTNIIIDYGFTFLQSSQSYKVDINHLFTSLIIYFIILILVLFGQIRKANKKIDIREMNTEGEEKRFNLKVISLILVISTIICLFAYLDIFKSYIGNYDSIIKIATAVIISICLTLALIHVFKNKSLFYKRLLNKRQFYHFVNMMLTVFIVIFLLTFTIDHLSNRINRLDQEYKFNLIVSRMLNNNDQVYQEITENEHVDQADQIGYFQNVAISDMPQTINQLISIDFTKINTYFNFEFDEIELSTQTLSIILPHVYHEVYNYQISDSFFLDISPSFQNVEFKILGFYQKEGIELAFINLNTSTQFDQLSQNAILINTSNQVLLQSELIDSYGQQMIIIYDYVSNVIDPLVVQMQRVRTYLSLIIGFMMLSFIISLFNHVTMLQLNLDQDHAKIYTLGYSKKQMIIMSAKINLIIFFIVLFTSIFAFLIISYALSDFIKIFKAYEYLIVSFKPILLGILLNIAIFTLIIGYQSRLIYKMKVIDQIRTF